MEWLVDVADELNEPISINLVHILRAHEGSSKAKTSCFIVEAHEP